MTSAPLWDWGELVRAAEGTAGNSPSRAVTGVSIDSRTLVPGDLFVAITNERDGHAFVTSAFRAGAAAALVSNRYEADAADGPLIRVDDPLSGMERLGIAARARLAPDARIVAVTGSAGKTGTKEMLRLCLSRLGPTHASEKSYNNRWGVPLTLARMPRATRYGVFEIGMNHPGEIGPLSRMVRPHAAIVTTVAPVHLAFFDSVAAIAEAKAEIFEGLEPGGTAVINCDNEFHWLLAHRAKGKGADIMGFGRQAASGAKVLDIRLEPMSSRLLVEIEGESAPVAVTVGAPGLHHAMNAAAVLAAVAAVGADAKAASAALADFKVAAGRGARLVFDTPNGPILVIDESYNANPASMRAALETLAAVPRSEFPRRIAVLGDMLELGREASALHEALAEPIEAAKVDLIFACGPHMRGLFERLPASCRGLWAERSDGLTATLLDAVRAGDAVMIKGSLGSRMAPLIGAFRRHFAAAGATP